MELDTINTVELEEHVKMEICYDSFIWLVWEDEKEKRDCCRIDVHFNEEKKKLGLAILTIGNKKRMKPQIKKMIEELTVLFCKEKGEHIKVVTSYTTPAIQAWREFSFFDLFAIPFLFIYTVLFFVVGKYVPYGIWVNTFVVATSFPFGYILSYGHNWGAGAPYAGFDVMCKIIKWKYATVLLSYVILAIGIVYLFLL